MRRPNFVITMSGVATLNAGGKRRFDDMAVDAPTAAAGCSPLRVRMLPPPTKRARSMAASCGASAGLAEARVAAARAAASAGCCANCGAASTAALSGGASGAPGANNGSGGERPFSAAEVASFAQHVPRRLKRVADKVVLGQVSTTDKLFSVVDVRDIVESVLVERETKLQDEYQKVLDDRLAEQFRDFTKFNEDHVARHLRTKDCTYLS